MTVEGMQFEASESTMQYEHVLAITSDGIQSLACLEHALNCIDADIDMDAIEEAAQAATAVRRVVQSDNPPVVEPAEEGQLEGKFLELALTVHVDVAPSTTQMVTCTDLGVMLTIFPSPYRPRAIFKTSTKRSLTR